MESALSQDEIESWRSVVMMVSGHSQDGTSHGQHSWLGGVGERWARFPKKAAITFAAGCVQFG